MRLQNSFVIQSGIANSLRRLDLLLEESHKLDIDWKETNANKMYQKITEIADLAARISMETDKIKTFDNVWKEMFEVFPMEEQCYEDYKAENGNYLIKVERANSVCRNRRIHYETLVQKHQKLSPTTDVYTAFGCQFTVYIPAEANNPETKGQFRLTPPKSGSQPKLPTFDGDSKKYADFIESFCNAVKNESECSKLKNLQMSVKGEAHLLMQHLPHISSNYKVARSILEDKYRSYVFDEPRFVEGESAKQKPTNCVTESRDSRKLAHKKVEVLPKEHGSNIAEVFPRKSRKLIADFYQVSKTHDEKETRLKEKNSELKSISKEDEVRSTRSEAEAARSIEKRVHFSISPEPCTRKNCEEHGRQSSLKRRTENGYESNDSQRDREVQEHKTVRWFIEGLKNDSLQTRAHDKNEVRHKKFEPVTSHVERLSKSRDQRNEGDSAESSALDRHLKYQIKRLVEVASEANAQKNGVDEIIQFLVKSLNARKQQEDRESMNHLKRRYTEDTEDVRPETDMEVSSSHGKQRCHTPCVFCPTSKYHRHEHCPTYTTAKQRKARAFSINVCLKCLRRRHDYAECPRRCFYCQGAHHEALCEIKYPENDEQQSSSNKN